MSLKGSSPAVNQIARESALDLGGASYHPDLISHTPGMASCIADALSRKYDPGSTFVLPPHVDGASELSLTALDSMVEVVDTAVTTWRCGAVLNKESFKVQTQVYKSFHDLGSPDQPAFEFSAQWLLVVGDSLCW